MSDITPRPDETPGDPTAPAQPADVEVTEVVPTTETAAPEDAAPADPADTAPADAAPESVTPPPPPAPEPYPQPAYAQPAYTQPQYAQQPPPPQLPPPAYAGAAPGTAVAGPNPLSPTDERTWGMLSHAIAAGAMVLSGGFLGFVGALVIYLLYKDRGPFVRAHSANSLNVQITAGIAIIIGWVLTITIIGAIIGIPLLIAAFIWALIVHVIGAVKANNGEWWTPPMTPQFVK
jgi:hypothetical protein